MEQTIEHGTDTSNIVEQFTESATGGLAVNNQV
jgi:hypothetical protein